MASKHQALLDYALSLTSPEVVFDFSQWDEANESFPDQGQAMESDAAYFKDGSPALNERGFVTDGLTHSVYAGLTNARDLWVRTVVFLFKPKTIKAGCLLDLGVGVSSAGALARVRLNADGTLTVDTDREGNTITTSGTLTADVVSIIALAISTTQTRITFGDINNPITETFDIPDGVAEDYFNVGLGSTRGGSENLPIEGYFFYFSDYTLSQIQIDGFITHWGIYGNLTLPTNLESSRFQSVIALDPDRAVDSTDRIPVGETHAQVALMTEAGQQIEFYAFDTGDGGPVLTTGPVVPDPQNPLQFEPVQGSDSGDGTGQARIAGTVQIDGTAARRDVLVISDDPSGRQVVGESQSQTDGSFDITFAGWTGPVIALALDTYGQAWRAETTLTAGAVIHPNAPNGYVYDVTVGGTTGTNEPSWPTDGTVQSGSVTLQARPFHRPIASGPLQSMVIDEPEPTLTTITAIRLKDMQSNDPNQSYVTLKELIFYDESGNQI